MDKKVLVGMSGGVDSSLAAALLVEQGHDVTGVFLKVWSEEELTGLSTIDSRLSSRTTYESRHTKVELNCPWQEDLADAQAVADQLGIKLIIQNVQRQYWDRVVAQFIDGYRRGVTPNPDILCNSEIKFGILYEWAMQQGYDYIATGHYARIKSEIRNTKNETNSKFEIRNSKHHRLQITNYELHRGRDDKKDQTYFLWKLDRAKLQHILFPIGELPKEKVRAEAATRGLITATKKGSQGICFLGKVNVRQWLREELNTQPGEVVDRHGRVIGRHDGVRLYTLGQRKGIRHQASGINDDEQPLYVVARNLEKNQLVVDTAPTKQRELHANQLNWIAGSPNQGDTIQARIRHGQHPQEAWISAISDDHILLEFSGKQTAIAPGQSVVFSQDDLVLGGGIIV